MKKILLIDFFYPPIGTSHAYRWFELSKHLQNYEVEISLVTSKSNKRSREVINSVNGDFFEVGLSQDRLAAYEGSAVSVKKNDSSKLKLLLKKAYRKVFWPDAYWYWFPSLFLFVAKLIITRRIKNYDGIISYSPTFISHIAGLFIKKSNPSMVWIADYGDPFSNSKSMPVNNYWLYGAVNNYVEKLVFLTSDFVTCTNQKTVCENKKLEPRGNFVILNHSVNVGDYCTDINLKFTRDNEFIDLVYIGAFHKGIREPFNVISYFSALNSNFLYRLNFYGPLNSCDVTGKNVNAYGIISKKHAAELMKNSQVLLNIENQKSQMSPSKLVELIASGRPILNYSDAGFSEIMLKAESYGQVLNISKDTSGILVDRFINGSFEYKLNTRRSSVLLHDYDNATVAKKILGMLT